MLKVTVGLLLVVWLVSLVDLAELGGAISRSRPGWIAAAFLAFSGVIAFEIARIWLFFRTEGLRFFPVARLFLESLLFMNLLPGTIGGDGYLVAGLRRYGIAVSMARIVFMRLIGILVLVAMALVSLPFAAQAIVLPAKFQIPVTGNGAFVVAAAIALTVAGLSISPRVRVFVAQQAKSAYAAIVSTPMPAMTGVFVVTVLMQVTRALMFVALAVSYGEMIEFSTGLLVAAAGVISLVIPISFSGLGVREAAIAGVLVAAGIPASTSVVVALTSRIFLLVGALSGLGCLLAGKTRVMDYQNSL